MCTSVETGEATESMASASAPPPESSSARADRLRRESSKAADIRSRYSSSSMINAARLSGAGTMASSAKAPASQPSLSRGQSAAGYRSAAMAKNRAAIGELRGRMGELNPVSPISSLFGGISLSQQVEALGQGATPVQIKSNSGIPITVGTISKSTGEYRGRAAYADIAKEAVKKGGNLASIDTSLKAAMDRQYASELSNGSDDSGRKSRVDPVVEDSVEVTQMGGGGSTTKTRRGGGRRTAFGTRSSLINLRNVR